MKRSSPLLIAVASLLSSSAALAQAFDAPLAGVESTANRHLGFYLRLDLGFGYLRSSSSAEGLDVAMSGFAGSFGVAIGGAVTENVIVGAHLWDAVVPDPSVSSGGQSGPTSGTSLGLVGFGPQLTYYFMPINLYLSATAGIGKLTVTNSGHSGATKVGFAGRLQLGKEWWVSDHWGLGLAGQASLGVNTDDNAQQNVWTTPVFTLAFSATYN